MNRKTKYITGFVLSVLVICALMIPAFALTESDVQSQVSASGKEGVAGNLFVWFLCAVAFLKISQKIDSFMQGLGINVGHTGGSMLAEAMLAARSIAAARGVAGRGRGGNAGRGGSTGGSGGGDSNTFLQGGLAGVVNRSFYNTNCVIAGHRGWRGADYFRHIDKLAVGDTVRLTNLWETLTYTVADIQIIQPHQIERIKIQSNRDLLTLLTCHPYASGGRQRYVVYCEKLPTMSQSR